MGSVRRLVHGNSPDSGSRIFGGFGWFGGVTLLTCFDTSADGAVDRQGVGVVCTLRRWQDIRVEIFVLLVDGVYKRVTAVLTGQ